LRGGISRRRDPFPPGNPIWYEWNGEHGTYKCRLCDSWIPNDAHLTCQKHTKRTLNPQYYWDAEKYPWDPCIWAVENQSELQYLSAELHMRLAEATSAAEAPVFAEAPRVEAQPTPFPDDVRRLEGYFANLQTTPETVVPCAASTAEPEAPAFADAGAGYFAASQTTPENVVPCAASTAAPQAPAFADAGAGPADADSIVAEDEQEEEARCLRAETAGRAELAEEDIAGRAAEVEAEEEPPPMEDAGGSRRRSRSAGFNKQSLRSFRPPSLAPEDRSTKQ